MKTQLTRTLCSASFALWAQTVSASIIFDDFNIDEGHFGFAANFSGTTVGEDAASAADRITIDGPFEGAGHQKLTLIHDATTTAFRLRHVSGGPPYNTSTAGAPASNVAFTTSAGTDGFIGFYLKTNATGWETMINLDGPTGATAEMRGSPSTAVIADGQWHLYEWDLDAVIWGTVPGITTQTTALLPDASHSIDSIYLRDLDASPGPTADFYFDFVAKSDAGSIAGLIPEPSAITLVAVGALGIAARRRRRLNGPEDF